MNKLLRVAHRYLGLTLLVLWLLQMLTGAIMVFHWELDDVGIAASSFAFDSQAIGRRIDAIQAEPSHRVVRTVYPSGAASGHFDIYVEDSTGAGDILRVDGKGTVLRTRPVNHDYSQVGWVDLAVVMHQSLFAGRVGKVLLGCSGALLLTNLIVGLKLAWPRFGKWRRALHPPRPGVTSASFYGWHRSIGLFLVGPASIVVLAGTLLEFKEPLYRWCGVETSLTERLAAPKADSAARLASRTTPAKAIQVALARYPRAAFAGLELPTNGASWYRVSVRQPEEPRRVFGTTTVYVDSRDGHVLADENAQQAPPGQRLVDLLYPIHTGEAAGIFGRASVLLISLLLLTMSALGTLLWWSRRSDRLRRLVSR